MPGVSDDKIPEAPTTATISGESRLQKGQIDLTFNKSKTKKTDHEVQLVQVNPSTKEIIEVYEKTATTDREVKFTDLPLGYEYYGKVRAVGKESKNGPKIFSEWVEFSDFVNLSNGI